MLGLEKIQKIKFLYEKNKKYRWFFFIKNLFKKKNFLHSIFLKLYNKISVKIWKDCSKNEGGDRFLVK